MKARRRDEYSLVLDGEARQRFYDARGYGRPLDANELALAPIEVVHLLLRGDLTDVDELDLQSYLEQHPSAFGPRYLAYADLRSRGFYVAPDRSGWVETPDDTADLVVYARGADRGGEIAYRIRVLDERTSLSVLDIGTTVLAVADEDGEITYFDTDRPDPVGQSTGTPPATTGSLLSDRVICWDPPTNLYTSHFYGSPIMNDDPSPLQLSLIEATALARNGHLTLDCDIETLLTTARSVAGVGFDRRLAVYERLRERGLVPKTGFKFGADFRIYTAVDSVDDLGHSEALIHTLPPDSTVTPRELSLFVRLAGGVRKRLLLAAPEEDGITFRELSRLTP